MFMLNMGGKKNRDYSRDESVNKIMNKLRKIKKKVGLPITKSESEKATKLKLTK